MVNDFGKCFLYGCWGRALIVCIPYFVTLFGSLLSSYNANIRICLPIVLGMPILLFMCLINTQ